MATPGQSIVASETPLAGRSVTAPSPHLQLGTLFVLDARQRIVSTREPNGSRASAFFFIRGDSSCVWAAGAHVSEPIALELNHLASQEPTSHTWEQPLIHSGRYESLLGGHIRSGPAFAFPEHLKETGDTSLIAHAEELNHHFTGWVACEIEGGRSPVLAVREGGRVVSVCFCARRSAHGAEAGVETATPFRGRGYAARAVIAWAKQVKAEGLTPLYSTDWSNRASLAVSRRLGLLPFATDFWIE